MKRGERLGKYTAKFLNQLRSLEFQKAVKNPFYKEVLMDMLIPNFETKKKDGPKTQAHVSELESIPFESFHISNPNHLAALFREYGHFGYNANTANRIMAVIQKEL